MITSRSECPTRDTVYHIWTHGRPNSIKRKLDKAVPHYYQWNQD